MHSSLKKKKKQKIDLVISRETEKKKKKKKGNILSSITKYDCNIEETKGLFD